MDPPVAEPARVAPALGGFLHRLHRASPEKFEGLVERDFYPHQAWREDAERDYREVSFYLPAAANRLVEDFLGRTPPAESHAVSFCHNDLGAEHLLADQKTGIITGAIDWADAAVTDPARDLAMIYRDLGPGVVDRTLARYGGGSTASTERDPPSTPAVNSSRTWRTARARLRAATRRPPWRASRTPSRKVPRAVPSAGCRE